MQRHKIGPAQTGPKHNAESGAARGIARHTASMSPTSTHPHCIVNLSWNESHPPANLKSNFRRIVTYISCFDTLCKHV